MARPSKNVEKEVEKKIEKEEIIVDIFAEKVVAEKSKSSNNVDIDELIALKVAEILAKKELERMDQLQVENEKSSSKKVKQLKPSQLMRDRKYVPDNTMVRVEQNIGGKFVISENRGSNYFIELNGYGNSCTMAFKDLKNYHGRHHSFLSRGKLKIISVTSEDSNIEFNDIIHDLNLQGIYNNDDKISPLDIEYYLLEEDDLKEFASKLRNSREILETIVEISFLLYQDNQFNDNAKMDVIRQITGNSNLYTHKTMPDNIRFINPAI